jgi:hypothetical protein
MRREVEHSLKSFLIELVVYGVLVAIYYLVVLHFMGQWLYKLFTSHRQEYAAVALTLIIGQGFLLEILTRLLLGYIRPRTEE